MTTEKRIKECFSRTEAFLNQNDHQWNGETSCSAVASPGMDWKQPQVKGEAIAYAEALELESREGNV